MGELAPELLNPPGEDVTVYPVMADPPFVSGTVKATLQVVFPPEATRFFGGEASVVRRRAIRWSELTLARCPCRP